MTSPTLTHTATKTSVIAALIAFVSARFSRPPQPETDYDVWTSGARGL